MRLVVFLLLFIYIGVKAFSLSISDFVPAFLTGKKDESRSLVKPFVEVKRNESATTTWYCTRMQNNVSNVFCDKESRNVTTKVVVETKYTKETNDNAISSSDAINKSMNERTALFQDSRVTNLLTKDQDQIQNSVMLPLQPSENVHMGVNAEQVQFKIQY